MSFNYIFHKEKYCLTILIIIFLCKSVQSQLIRPVGYSKKEKNAFITKPSNSSMFRFEMKYSFSNIHVDFGTNQQQIIVIRNEDSVKLKLSFKIHAPLPEIYKTLINEFCHKVSVNSESTCQKIPQKGDNLKWFNMDIQVKWLEDRSGFKLGIDHAKKYLHDLSGFYYFKSSSPAAGMILSNFLEIRDVLYWKQNMKVSATMKSIHDYYHNLNELDIPKIFSCFDHSFPFNLNDIPFWVPLEFNSFVKWAWCPVAKQTAGGIMEQDKSYVSECLRYSDAKCEMPQHLCPIKLADMPGWKGMVSFDGKLTLFGGTRLKHDNTQVNGYALMCYTQLPAKAIKFIAKTYDASFATFTDGLHWVPGLNTRVDFILRSTPKQLIKVGTLKKGFLLTAIYYGPSNFTYEWIRNDEKIEPSEQWAIDPYHLEFKSVSTMDMQGMYYLRIKSPSKQIEFSFEVEILSPPIFLQTSFEPINSTVYLMVNSNFSISFLYKGNITNANLYINGVQYRPGISDHQVFLNDLSQKAFNLKHLDFYFYRTDLSGGVTNFTYVIKKVLFPEHLLIGQDHNLIIEAFNDYGVSRVMLNIYVLKPPKFENLPLSDNCTSYCFSSQPHLFRCELNKDYYIAREVQVEKFWLVDDIRLDSLPYHEVYFKTDDKGLNLMPVKTNNSNFDIALKKLLKNARLICRVRLLYPESTNMIDAKLIQENRIIYDTFHDATVMSHFSAQIRLDWEPKIATASYTWMIFLAIAILLIVMFIFLLVKFTLRGQGKSYQIEKLEIAKGYNRDEEIIENETIRPYLRSNANNANSQMNNSEKDSTGSLINSSLNYSPPNGNGTFRPRDVLDIIDDEENAIDPSKFNEEGSFIGIYASKGNHSNLPAEAKI